MADRIRLAHCGDMQALALLWHHAVHEGAQGAYNAEQRAAWSPTPKSAAFMTERLTDQAVFVAEDEHGLAGFFSLKPDGELDMAYVRPDRKGDGLASRLLQAVITQAQSWALDRLTVQASHIARRFFEKHGWHLERTQTVSPNGVEMQNHVMTLHLHSA